MKKIQTLIWLSIHFLRALTIGFSTFCFTLPLHNANKIKWIWNYDHEKRRLKATILQYGRFGNKYWALQYQLVPNPNRKMFYFIITFFVPFGIFFVPFGTFFAHDLTPRTRLAMLHLGLLSFNGGQKRIRNIKNAWNFCNAVQTRSFPLSVCIVIQGPAIYRVTKKKSNDWYSCCNFYIFCAIIKIFTPINLFIPYKNELWFRIMHGLEKRPFLNEKWNL